LQSLEKTTRTTKELVSDAVQVKRRGMEGKHKKAEEKITRKKKVCQGVLRGTLDHRAKKFTTFDLSGSKKKGVAFSPEGAGIYATGTAITGKWAHVCINKEITVFGRLRGGVIGTPSRQTCSRAGVYRKKKTVGEPGKASSKMATR